MFPATFRLIVLALTCSFASLQAQVVINEIHYNPVEKANFDAAGNPTYSGTGGAADFTDDVHEFLEVFNAGTSPVDVSGWRLSSGVDYTFPAGTTIPAGGYRVIAKNPARTEVVYGITGVLGPYSGKLANNGDTIRLRDPEGITVDSVRYSTQFPWAISANKLGADDDFTGLDSAAYQYKGRSLQRVSVTASANDPANWVAVRPALGTETFADLPTPGAANLIVRPVPKPVVVAFSVAQNSNNAPIILNNAPVKLTCSFSNSTNLTDVQVEYFVENVSSFAEARFTEPMVPLGNNQYSAVLPGRAARSVVRWRIKANRDGDLEVVFPRADDPAVVQVGPPTYQASPPRIPAPREAWHAYFVTAPRSSTKPIYDVFVPTDGTAIDDSPATNTQPFNGINGLQSMAYDCKGSPKRVTAESTNGAPREVPYVLPTDRIWNNVVPGIFVTGGVVRDIQIRYHGSRYNRRPSRNSFKVFFPDYAPYNGATSTFITDKGDHFSVAHGLHQEAGLPLSSVRYVDWYLNNDSVRTRLEQGEYNGELLEAFHEQVQRLNPGSKKEATGEYYKSVGYIVSPNTSGEGPYGNGNGWLLPAAGRWSSLQRYDYTYALQNHSWKGAKPIMDLITSLWQARGDTHTSPNPNPLNLRSWFQANWDVDTELTSLALGNWMAPWDDTCQNHFFWRRAPKQKPDGTFENPKWVRLLWDFDAMYGQSGDGRNAATSSIFTGEVNDIGNNSRGPNYFKDSFFKAYRNEYRTRLWFLNNTLLDPDNLATLTYRNSSGSVVTYRAMLDSQTNAFGSSFAIGRFNKVNELCALGVFYKPNRPANTFPANNAAVLPSAALTGSAYSTSAAFTKAAPPTMRPHAWSKWEVRTASGSYLDPVLVQISTTHLTTLPIPFNQLTYGQTYFWRVTYFDADERPSIPSAETSFSYGPTSTAAGNVVLNEILAENRSAAANGSTFPDYIELRNNTANPINLLGWSLTDDELVPNKFSFPADAILPPNGYLVVWCDKEFAAPGLHSGFALSRAGQRVILSENNVVRDAIAYGPQIPNISVGRIADGTGGWTLVNPTPGLTNTARPFGSIAMGLKINEWMANPATGDDWFEIFNSSAEPVSLAGLWLSDTPTTPKITQIPPLSFIPAKGYVIFTADGTTSGFEKVNFKLNNAGESIVLTAGDGVTTIDAVTFGAQALNVSQGLIPNGGGALLSFANTASPNASNWVQAAVVINEALTNSTPPFEDAVELHNPSATSIDIGGWWLSDDRDTLQKFQIPNGTTIPADGFAVLYENQFNSAPGQAGSFSLSSLGEELILSAVDAEGNLTGFRAQVRFGAAAENTSFGRVPTAGAPEFWPVLATSFGVAMPGSVQQFRTGLGAGNTTPRIGPVVINEVMYHPPDGSGGADNARDEFIELHNITTSPVDLSGWRVTGESDLILPPATVIRPGDYMLLVSFNPSSTSTVDAFRQKYGLDSDTRIFGPFAPKLANSTQIIELAYPGAPSGDVTPLIMVDRVQYADGPPWPAAADGGGASLQRQSRSAIGNDAANWSAAVPTPGNVNQGQSPIVDSDGDGMTDTYEIAHGLDRFDATDAAADADGDGQTNLSEFIAGTDVRDPISVFNATVTKVAGGYKIEWLAQPQKSYSVLARDDLKQGTWVKVADHPAQPSTHNATFTEVTTATTRFYRIVTPQAP